MSQPGSRSHLALRQQEGPRCGELSAKGAAAGSPPAGALAQADWQPHSGSQVQRKQERAAGTTSVQGQGHSHHTPSIL